MDNLKVYEYRSALSSLIEEFIEEKRKLGFKYELQAYNLKRFDEYWTDHGYTDTAITEERLQDWLCALPNEGKSSQAGRISTIKGLISYLNSKGIESHVPLVRVQAEKAIVHVLSKAEIKELFNVIDGYRYTGEDKLNKILANEYPIIFRLYYCCGMRNTEVCGMKLSDVDLVSGIITINGGKGHKSRLVYLPEDLRILMEKYHKYLCRELGQEPYWMFPSRKIEKHIQNTTIDSRFTRFWSQTSFSATCDKKPTPHCLRHTFVVDRINSWIKQGVEWNVMSIYLSKFLGHNGPDETFYYYHMVSEAFDIIHSKDTMAARVIPEMRRI